MKTLIFKNYSEFIQREDKSVNGVSTEFAEANPNFEKENETNEACWNCSRCSDCSDCYDCSDCSDCSGCYDCYDCSGCSDCSDCSGCYDCYDCSGCSRCSRCSGCSDCSRCSRCSGCSDCSRCYDCSGCSGCYDCSDCSGCYGCYDCYGLKDSKPQEFKMPETPLIENIHQKLLEVVTNEGILKMDVWHGEETKNEEGAYCGTTHCRAGWVIALAGKDGVELEKIFGTENAAMQIYKKSSEIRVSPTQFYKNNETAMEDIERCAKEEIELNSKK